MSSDNCGGRFETFFIQKNEKYNYFFTFKNFADMADKRERELSGISDAPPEKDFKKSEKQFRVVNWGGELMANVLYREGDLVDHALNLAAEQTGHSKFRIQLCYGEKALVAAETLDSFAIPEGADVQLTISVQVRWLVANLVDGNQHLSFQLYSSINSHCHRRMLCFRFMELWNDWVFMENISKAKTVCPFKEQMVIWGTLKLRSSLRTDACFPSLMAFNISVCISPEVKFLPSMM